MNWRVWLWVFNIVLGVACFNLAQANDSISPLGAVFVVLFVEYVVMKLRQRRRTALAGEANRALESGRFVAAIELWSALQKAGDESAYLGVALGCIGVWQLDRARDALRTRSPSRWSSQREYERQFSAIIDALSGARAWSAAELAGLPAPVIALVNGILSARAGAWSRLLTMLPPETVRPLSGQLRAIAEAVRAWALRETSQPMPPVDIVGVLGETGPDAVRRYWPEFAGFLESAAKPTATSSLAHTITAPD